MNHNPLKSLNSFSVRHSDINGKRVDKKLGVHFPFTSRKECLCQLCQHLNHKAPDGFVCDRIMEKQVDSSLVADAITLSMDSEKAKLIIVSNDDDVIPGLITGESIGGDICLLNTVQKNHTHAQQLKDIIFGPEDFVA
ncbi:NYN domain-containing protein [Komagataeibacter rhaeticus]|uniref:NYN domain-containing protein n=2 Tax=Komagataeibacter rhaeticus TaxID=215221 RepID=A0A858JMB5_9PROT|nr:NYN domain-containing protein [Komagataeibacter rhaeticus]QIP36824.1 NYN domain-containing protein [Komagataeibacter rhaeticus]